MSYARHLYARSRSALPASAAAASPAVEPLREEHVEVVAGELPRVVGEPPRRRAEPRPVPAPGAPAIVERAAPSAEPSAIAPPSIAPAPVAAPSIAAPSTPPAGTAAVAPELVVEHERIPAEPPRRALSAANLPPQAAWLAEDAAAPDPLVAVADTDELRDLLRSVRQWTASAPTAIASPAAVPPPPQAPVPPPPDEPVRVSIGNVTITVEDAPAAQPRGRGPAHEPSGSDRLARNFIRGG